MIIKIAQTSDLPFLPRKSFSLSIKQVERPLLTNYKTSNYRFDCSILSSKILLENYMRNTIIQVFLLFFDENWFYHKCKKISHPDRILFYLLVFRFNLYTVVQYYVLCGLLTKTTHVTLLLSAPLPLCQFMFLI